MYKKPRVYKKLETLLKKEIMQAVDINIVDLEGKLYKNDKIFLDMFTISIPNPKRSSKPLKVTAGYIDKNGFSKDPKKALRDFESHMRGRKQKEYIFEFQVEEVYQNSYYNSYQRGDTLEMNVVAKYLNNGSWEWISTEADLTNLGFEDESEDYGAYTKDDDGNIEVDGPGDTIMFEEIKKRDGNLLNLIPKVYSAEDIFSLQEKGLDGDETLYGSSLDILLKHNPKKNYYQIRRMFDKLSEVKLEEVLERYPKLLSGKLKRLKREYEDDKRYKDLASKVDDVIITMKDILKLIKRKK
jgi:hypothetical protein